MCSHVWAGVRFGDLRIPSLLFADDVVLLASMATSPWGGVLGSPRPQRGRGDYVSGLAGEALGISRMTRNNLVKLHNKLCVCVCVCVSFARGHLT